MLLYLDAERTLAEKLVKHFGEELVVSQRSKRRVVFSLQIFEQRWCVWSSIWTRKVHRDSSETKKNCYWYRGKAMSITPLWWSYFQRRNRHSWCVLKFLCIVITGEESLEKASQKASIYVHSTAADLTYQITTGKIKPGKHLLLGMGMKCITGSGKVLEILSSMGSCTGYQIVEALEKALREAVTEQYIKYVLREFSNCQTEQLGLHQTIMMKTMKHYLVP